VLPIVAIVVSLGFIACWIIVEVKIFQSGDILWGVLGICPLVSFIYGWVKNQDLDIRNVMLVWTIFYIANFVLRFALMSQGAHQ
jgi:hypothetical protein